MFTANGTESLSKYTLQPTPIRGVALIVVIPPPPLPPLILPDLPLKENPPKIEEILSRDLDRESSIRARRILLREGKLE